MAFAGVRWIRICYLPIDIRDIGLTMEKIDSFGLKALFEIKKKAVNRLFVCFRVGFFLSNPLLPPYLVLSVLILILCGRC